MPMYYYIIAGDFGAWTAYGQCEYDSLEYRSRVCYCYCYFYLVESFHPIQELK